MTLSRSTPTREEFNEWVREALNRLYDTPYLQKHPLTKLLVENDPTPTSYHSQNLRRTLLEAIRAMRPGPGIPAQSPDWRAYRILELRYIEGLTPSEVMSELALGKSQYFRDQARVLDALSDLLWAQWRKARRETADTGDPARQELIRTEADRLRAQATWRTVDVAELLDDLHAVVNPLAKAKNASVNFVPLRHLATLHADRVMLRQAILNAITCALDVARGGRVDIVDFAKGNETGIHIVACRSDPTEPPQKKDAQWAKVDTGICRQLTTTLGGRLDLETGPGDRWEARLVWPIPVPHILLVVDDNEGLIDLFRHYLTGHGWQMVGATSGADARKVIAETRPTIIAMDVMMPEEDGWELLLSLKTNDDTRNIPAIVCSILSEPQLALELGAVAYLQKPVTQKALLQALAPWNQGANLEPAH